MRVPVPDQGLLAWFTFPASATGEGSRGFSPASLALALLNTQGTPVEKTGCKLPLRLHLPGFFTFVLSVLDLQHLSWALSSSHVLPQASQCTCAVSSRKHLDFRLGGCLATVAFRGAKSLSIIQSFLLAWSSTLFSFLHYSRLWKAVSFLGDPPPLGSQAK